MDATKEFLPLWKDFSYKAHQVTGLRWLLHRETQTPAGGLLCDEMGLGKTIQILGLLINSPKPKSLLLCPKAVISQWISASRRSGLNVMTVEEKGWVSSSGRFIENQPTIYITNYEKIPSKPFLFKQAWNRVLLDEAHRLSNPRSIQHQNIAKLVRDITWVITATPIVNSIKDLRTLLQLVGFEQKDMSMYDTLCQRVSEAVLHRSMEEMRPIIEELPQAAMIEKKELDFVSEEEAHFYRGVQGKIMERFTMLEADQTPLLLKLLLKLRQLSVHPQVYIQAQRRTLGSYSREDWASPSTKFTVVRNMLEQEKKPTKWILFCQFHDEMEILEAYLSKSKTVQRIQQYHGGLSDKEKEDVIRNTYDFCDDGHDVLLLQLQSGGVGLNLQHFTRIIFLSPWWTSALMEQAIGRAVRIGQKEQVQVTLLVLKEEDSLNIDQAMLEKAMVKSDLLKRTFQHASRGIEEKEKDEDEQEGFEEESDEESDEESLLFQEESEEKSVSS